jgi:DNA repair protein RadC
MQLYSKDQHGVYRCAPHTAILESIRAIAHNRLNQEPYTSADNAKNYFQSWIGQEEREQFCVLFLNTQHRLIDAKCMFMGTIDATNVYPREIIKEALKQNAAAIILGHNHPSGDLQFSQADLHVTNQINLACKTVGLRLLDHILVSTEGAISAAEEGKL